MKPMECKCTGWKKSINLLNRGLSMASAKGYQYEGDMFVYCPWCGKELTEVEKK